MYLSELRLWNFRKFGSNSGVLDLSQPDLIAPFTKGLNVLIGENDSGKTAIVDAIKLVIDTHSSEWIRLATEDFHDQSTRLRIECRFEDLSDDEAKNFTEWLGIEGEGAAASLYLRVILDASRQGDNVLPFDVRAGLDEEGYRLNAEARNYLKATYLKPLRDAKSELLPRKGSRLSQILVGHEAFRDRDDSHWLMRGFKNFKQAVEEYFREAKDGDDKGKLLKDRLEKYLENFFGERKTVNFLSSDKKLKEVLEILKLVLEEESLGLGSHNLLFIAAELLNLERSNWNGLRLGLIEELEAHIHPQAQLKVIAYLQTLTQEKDKTIQLILTMHSPNLGSKITLDNLIICGDGKVFPLGSQYTKLKDDDYKFLERFLDVTKANLFFAKGVILVEGWAEELILPALARKVSCNLTQRGVSIVNVGSTAFLRYSRIFQRKDGDEIDIPVSVVTDLDVKPEEESILVPVGNENKKKTKGLIQKGNIEQQFNGQKVKTFVSPHWTLEYCLANSTQLSPLFFKAVEKVHSRIGTADVKKIADKLENHTLRKAEIAQVFADMLMEAELSRASLEADPNIKYLVDAIKYASGN
jgi:putative ATP-dependent endonuclease of OLD family